MNKYSFLIKDTDQKLKRCRGHCLGKKGTQSSHALSQWNLVGGPPTQLTTVFTNQEAPQPCMTRVLIRASFHRCGGVKPVALYWNSISSSPPSTVPDAGPEFLPSDHVTGLCSNQPLSWSYLGVHLKSLLWHNKERHFYPSGNSKDFWSSVPGLRDKEQIYS